MRDLKDLKREDEGMGPKKKPPYFMIGLLGVLVFLTLVFVFRTKEESPEPPPPPPVSQLAPDQSPAAPAELSEKEEPVVPDPALKPGEMRFDSKPEPFPAAPPPGNAATAQAPGNPIPKEDLTFFDTLKDKEKKSVALQTKKETKPAAQKTKRPPEKKSDPKKVSVPPTSGPSGAYTIQVASFAERKGAETLSQKLKKKGYDVYVAAGEIPEKGTRYRVRIGHYPSRAEAQKAAERIREAEKLSFLITTDTGK
ncbi:SPOR domain-containing protein [Candidatus Manganitrophus noduliformans]|uniref:SPOR domain-containing protein n=1 Tax=Candidatus Manganitrophus noduliformans TaxID=2606439 RepID=A0A7X6I9C8_9BACT|nr:SPOR domain-containing protein [Candidatus Manganitrophus noduliformans]NKE69338.1 SPOR domain-containing protein [Candidatus Manganitrophus noduliformans]